MRYFNIKEFLNGHFDIFYKTRRWAMNFIKHIFSSLTPSFLIRNYFFGGIITAIILFIQWNYSSEGLGVFIWGCFLLSINLIFYPFATLIYEEIRNMIMGDTVLITHIIVMAFWKLFIKLAIFVFAIPIGIIGIIYIWYRTKDNV